MVYLLVLVGWFSDCESCTQAPAEFSNTPVFKNLDDDLLGGSPPAAHGTWARFIAFREAEKTPIQESVTINCTHNVIQCDCLWRPTKIVPTALPFMGGNNAILAKDLKHLTQKVMGNPQLVGNVTKKNGLSLSVRSKQQDCLHSILTRFAEENRHRIITIFRPLYPNIRYEDTFVKSFFARHNFFQSEGNQILLFAFTTTNPSGRDGMLLICPTRLGPGRFANALFSLAVFRRIPSKALFLKADVFF